MPTGRFYINTKGSYCLLYSEDDYCLMSGGPMANSPQFRRIDKSYYRVYKQNQDKYGWKQTSFEELNKDIQYEFQRGIK